MNCNPLLDTYMYETEYLDHDTVELTDNRISNTIYKATDSDKNESLLFKAILDHRKYAVSL